MIKSLPSWRFKDIERLPMPIVELAAKAMNERYDEMNRFHGAIHGVKMESPKSYTKQAINSRIKTAMLNSRKGVKSISRAELNKALGDG